LQKLREIKELTGIRFFAAFHVLFFHNYYTAGSIVPSTPSFLKNIFSFGDSAVAFFFILSGFILSYVYVNDKNELKTSKTSFAWARFSRLYPVYIFALIMDLPRGINYFLSEYDLSTGLIKIFISLTAYLTMLQSWYPRVTASWNPPAWSLSVEAFFYIIFPFIIPVLFKLKANLKVLISLYLLPIILYFVLDHVLLVDFQNPTVATLWRSFPALRVTEFLIGILLGKIFREQGRLVSWIKKNTKLASLMFWGSLIFSLFIVAIDLNIARELRMNAFLIPCFAIMILLLASTKIKYTGFFRLDEVVLLGNASFTLYIIHQPVLYYMNFIALEKGILFFTLYCFITITLSLLIYKYFEVPMQRILRKRNPFT
jgi:peptidoglycan/LPS O-acetylase OafA/YrhL